LAISHVFSQKTVWVQAEAHTTDETYFVGMFQEDVKEGFGFFSQVVTSKSLQKLSVGATYSISTGKSYIQAGLGSGHTADFTSSFEWYGFVDAPRFIGLYQSSHTGGKKPYRVSWLMYKMAPRIWVGGFYQDFASTGVRAQILFGKEKNSQVWIAGWREEFSAGFKQFF